MRPRKIAYGRNEIENNENPDLRLGGAGRASVVRPNWILVDFCQLFGTGTKKLGN